MTFSKATVQFTVMFMCSWAFAQDDQSYFFVSGLGDWSYTKTYEVEEGCQMADPG